MRWLNISYNDPGIRRQVDQLCGKPHGLWEMIRRGGSGTPRLELADASDALMAPFDRMEDRRFCSIEVRSAGLLVRCRSRLETLALPLPDAEVQEVVLNAPGGRSYGVMRIRTITGGMLLMHVPRDHWGTVSRMLRKALPDGRFRTRATAV